MVKSPFLFFGVLAIIGNACSPFEPITLDGGSIRDGMGQLPGSDAGSSVDSGIISDSLTDLDGCVAESNDEFCLRIGKDCGLVMAADNCGIPREAACGVCEFPEECGVNEESVCGVQGMVKVSAGDFWMGCRGPQGIDCIDREKPYHKVYLNSFFIDTYEVRAGDYRLCVEMEACSYSGSTVDERRNYNNGRENHPMNFVLWNDAKTYCEFVGKRLPTEAEWEKASRGGCEYYESMGMDCQNDSFKYPWGNEEATCEFAVVNEDSSGCGEAQTWEVGSKPNGKSPYGALDMAGNVWEWTADWYDADYYDETPYENPQNNNPGTYRVIRGGAFSVEGHYSRSSNRKNYGPTSSDSATGFRCAL